MKAALQLQPLLFCRPSELRLATWADFALDGKNPVFSIPSSRLKRTLQAKLNGEPHLVPLSAQAVAILRELRAATASDGVVFRSVKGRGRKPISDMALIAAVRSMGFESDELSNHGWRATARTLLDEQLGERVAVIEMQLAHRVRDALGSAYNRTAFLAERALMMKRWSDYLDTLKPAAR